MTQEEFTKRWQADEPIYKAWGDFIISAIIAELSKKITPISTHDFLKIQVTPRLKKVDSLLDKAFARNKLYKDPYTEITDKVGIRFVVLLTDHIKLVEDIVTSKSSPWSYSKDKDYEADRESNPLEFTYQSVHYVLTSNEAAEHTGTKIPAGITCEVQIRTLLQHAHCELTHDTTYKPKSKTTSKVKRHVAKSIALIEAADDYFKKVFEDLEAIDQGSREILSILSSIYETKTGLTANHAKTNIILADILLELAPEKLGQEIEALLSAKGFILTKIKENYSTDHFYRQPIILLIYLLVEKNPATIKQRWPLEEAQLQQFFTQLGKSYESV